MTKIIENNNASQESVEFSDDFGHWLAGFLDGEGSFGIVKITADKGYFCRMAMQMRDDDAPILHEIQRRTGIGTVYYKKGRGTINPGVVWNVSKKADCMALVDLLDRYPMRAKKERDYRIWREAVLKWDTVISGKKFDWSHIAALKEQLQEGRRYASLEE